MTTEIPAEVSRIAVSTGVELAYEEFGRPTDPAVLLIMGFGAQMTDWPIQFCELIADQGYRVIRFDNRDIGQSTRMSGMHVSGNLYARMVRYFAALPNESPYRLEDMAADAVGLLDALEIPQAHVVGGSMGGMIAQIIGGSYPDRVLSLGVLFSTTNQRFLPPVALRGMQALLSKPENTSREAVVDFQVRMRKVIESPKYPTAPEVARAEIERNYDRGYYPAGIARQFAAILASGDLRRYDRRVVCPTVVVHGDRDPLVLPMCGRQVAKAISGSKFELIDGMGHDLPEELLPQLAKIFVANMNQVQDKA